MEKEDIIRLLEQKANNGDINSKIVLVLNKIDQDLEEGIKELIELSNKSDVACHNLIKIVNSRKLEKYYFQTFETTKKLAEYGETALIDMGVIYQLGILGQEKNIEKAIDYFQKAIDVYQSGVACQSIGAIYYIGKDTKRDYEKAYNYFEMGAKLHYADCEESLAKMYLYGNYVEIDYFMASFWYEKAFKDGKITVATYIANMYLPDNNMLNDEELAFEWYYKGSNYNIPECLLGMGYLYKNGIVVTKNNLVAKQYFERALNLGIKEAEILLEELNSKIQTAQRYDNITNSGIYLNKTTATGMAQVERNYEQKKQAKKDKNREILRVAAAANNSTGVIVDDFGYLLDKDGNEIYVDADLGYIFNEKTGDISFYDKNLHTVYNSDKKDVTYLDVHNNYIYNCKTGNVNYTSGNTIIGN